MFKSKGQPNPLWERACPAIGRAAAASQAVEIVLINLAARFYGRFAPDRGTSPLPQGIGLDFKS